MTRILVVTPFAEQGGAERALVGLVRHLPARGFEPLIGLLEPGLLEAWLEETGCEVATCPSCEPESQVDWVRDLALTGGARLVLSNKTEGHLVGAPGAERAGLPAVWWQQNLPRGYPEERQAATQPVKAIVCSSALAVEAQRSWAPAAQIETIHLGSAVGEIVGRHGSGAGIHASLAPQNGPIVGVVGRLERLKGQDVFLEAAGRVAQRHPEARFVLIGGALPGKEPEYRDRLRRLVSRLGLDDRVVFAGHQEDVYPWFDALDVVVQASRLEGFGLVLVEAMALGKPLVATDAGDPAELVEDGVCGFRVPTESAEAMAEAISRLLDDPVLAAALGEAAARRAPLFSEERMADAFAGLFRDLLAQG